MGRRVGWHGVGHVLFPIGHGVTVKVVRSGTEQVCAAIALFPFIRDALAVEVGGDRAPQGPYGVGFTVGVERKAVRGAAGVPVYAFRMRVLPFRRPVSKQAAARRIVVVAVVVHVLEVCAVRVVVLDVGEVVEDLVVCDAVVADYLAGGLVMSIISDFDVAGHVDKHDVRIGSLQTGHG